MTGGFHVDAEAWGRVVRELLERPRPRIWAHVPVGSVDEADYIAWAARWAFHWAAASMRLA